jgi:hypothetical protein
MLQSTNTVTQYYQAAGQSYVKCYGKSFNLSTFKSALIEIISY